MANEIGTTAQGLLEKVITYDDKGTGHVTQKDYYDIMASLGVPKEVIDAKVKADTELYNGMYRVCADETIKRAKAAKKKGEDPLAAKTILNIKIPKGSAKMTMDGARTFMASSAVGDSDAPREKIVKTLVTRMDIKQTSAFDKPMMRTMEDVMQEFVNK